jgi:hypothetical protein
MAGNEKKTKTIPPPKTEAATTKKDPSPTKDKAALTVEPSKAEGDDPAAASPKSYSRGEGQKPVSQAYKDNWNAIYGKRNKKKQ